MPSDLTTLAGRYLLYDALTLFLLALTASLRARFAGEKAVGSFLCGAVSSLSWALARELFLGGSVLALFSARTILAALLLGAFVGTLAAFIEKSARFLPALSLAALSLATSFGLLCALTRVEPFAALILAFVLAIVPELMTDISLGDMARFVSDGWRNMRALLGAILALALSLLLPLWPSLAFLPADIAIICVGLSFPLILLALRRSP